MRVWLLLLVLALAGCGEKRSADESADAAVLQDDLVAAPDGGDEPAGQGTVRDAPARSDASTPTSAADDAAADEAERATGDDGTASQDAADNNTSTTVLEPVTDPDGTSTSDSPATDLTEPTTDTSALSTPSLDTGTSQPVADPVLAPASDPVAEPVVSGLL